MGVFKSSKISFEVLDDIMEEINNHPLISDYYGKWGNFVESNISLWIKEKTELDMVLNLNFDSISATLKYLLNTKDQKKLKPRIEQCNKASVVNACVIGVGYSVLNKETITSINQLPFNIKQTFDFTYLPSFKLFEIIFNAHYKTNSHMAFQRNGHLEDTKRGIIKRTVTSCIEGSKAATKLNFNIF